jgi:hypothetical protein
VAARECYVRGPVLEVFRVLRLLESISSLEAEAQAQASLRSRGYASSYRRFVYDRPLQ